MKIRCACGFWVKEDDEKVIDYLTSVEEMPTPESIAEAFGLPVSIENDVKACLIGEKIKLDISDETDTAYLLVNGGIVRMTDNNRGNENLMPGVLRLHDHDRFTVSCADENHDHTPQADGGLLTYGTMSEADLEAELKNAANSWVHDAFTQVDENLIIDKPFYLDDGGCIVVPSGTTLTINAHFKVIGGKLELQNGSALVMGENGVLELIDGVVYVADGAAFPEGDYRGSAAGEDFGNVAAIDAFTPFVQRNLTLFEFHSAVFSQL